MKYKLPKFNNYYIVLLVILFFSSVVLTFLVNTNAQELESTNYKIIDNEINSGGGVAEGSSNYDLLGAIGNPAGDARLTSGTYRIGSGFPNGIQANVPLVRCFETTTNSGTTNCTEFPNTNGAIGECGNPGCYDRAKIEIDPQNNPIDALYLVLVRDTDAGIQYYLQSTGVIDIGANTTIADYQTICDIQGIDTRTGSGCENSGDPNWSESKQSANILGLNPNTNYEVTLRAYNGDFSESELSPAETAQTTVPALEFAIDIGTTNAAVNNPPYNIDFGTITTDTVLTATNKSWLKFGTNAQTSSTITVEDDNSGLLYSGNLIPSNSGDLSLNTGGQGGFGIDVVSTDVSLGSLGPIIVDSNFDNLGTNFVGGLSTTPVTFASTNTTGSNLAQLSNGIIGVTYKLYVDSSTPAGLYEDQLTYTYTAIF